ncbi:MAG: hypothetical protein P8Y05_05795 [Deinococcales bacterium]
MSPVGAPLSDSVTVPVKPESRTTVAVSWTVAPAAKLTCDVESWIANRVGGVTGPGAAGVEGLLLQPAKPSTTSSAVKEDWSRRHLRMRARIIVE